MQLNDDEVPNKMKHPEIDRSSKPNIHSTTVNTIQRDFSAEYGSTPPGLTGLRNLGNTCYMNSIIQCLLNIEQLGSYLKSGHFLNYLNR